MSKDKIGGALEAARGSVEKLKEALKVYDGTKAKDENREILADAVIKRFEVAFEYCWKLMKAGCEYQGGEAFGPRPAIQESIRFGWIENPDFWAQALDARNGSVHDYFNIPRSVYLEIVKRFVKEVSPLFKAVGDL